MIPMLCDLNIRLCNIFKAFKRLERDFFGEFFDIILRFFCNFDFFLLDSWSSLLWFWRDFDGWLQVKCDQHLVCSCIVMNCKLSIGKLPRERNNKVLLSSQRSYIIVQPLKN